MFVVQTIITMANTVKIHVDVVLDPPLNFWQFGNNKNNTLHHNRRFEKKVCRGPGWTCFLNNDIRLYKTFTHVFDIRFWIYLRIGKYNQLLQALINLVGQIDLHMCSHARTHTHTMEKRYPAAVDQGHVHAHIRWF